MEGPDAPEDVLFLMHLGSCGSSKCPFASATLRWIAHLAVISLAGNECRLTRGSWLMTGAVGVRQQHAFGLEPIMHLHAIMTVGQAPIKSNVDSMRLVWHDVITNLLMTDSPSDDRIEMSISVDC